MNVNTIQQKGKPVNMITNGGGDVNEINTTRPN